MPGRMLQLWKIYIVFLDDNSYVKTRRKISTTKMQNASIEKCSDFQVNTNKQTQTPEAETYLHTQRQNGEQGQQQQPRRSRE